MKKSIYAVVVLLVVAGGVVLANRESKKETAIKSAPKPLPEEEKKSEREKWEATPSGMAFKKWEASPAGQKVLTGIAKINKQISDSSNMEAVVTSLSLPEGSRLGFGVMVRINEEDYILSFPAENSSELEQLQSLKINDKIIIRSRNVSYAPKYSFPIISADYAERESKMIYKRVPGKGGC